MNASTIHLNVSKTKGVPPSKIRKPFRDRDEGQEDFWVKVNFVLQLGWGNGTRGQIHQHQDRRTK